MCLIRLYQSRFETEQGPAWWAMCYPLAGGRPEHSLLPLLFNQQKSSTPLQNAHHSMSRKSILFKTAQQRHLLDRKGSIKVGKGSERCIEPASKNPLWDLPLKKLLLNIRPASLIVSAVCPSLMTTSDIQYLNGYLNDTLQC